MKKYILTITILIVVISAFFAIKANQDRKEEKESYPVENQAEREVDGLEGMTDGNETINNEEIEKEEKKATLVNDFIQCLADAGVVIYGSKTCPACAALINSFGGYERVKSIYVECSEEWDRCRSEMQTNYVPEIQIQGELYSGSRSPDSIAGAVDCEI